MHGKLKINHSSVALKASTHQRSISVRLFVTHIYLSSTMAQHKRLWELNWGYHNLLKIVILRYLTYNWIQEKSHLHIYKIASITLLNVQHYSVFMDICIVYIQSWKSVTICSCWWIMKMKSFYKYMTRKQRQSQRRVLTDTQCYAEKKSTIIS